MRPACGYGGYSCARPAATGAPSIGELDHHRAPGFVASCVACAWAAATPSSQRASLIQCLIGHDSGLSFLRRPVSRTPPSGWLLCPATVAAAGLRIELRSLRRLHRAAPAPAPAASRPAATPPLAFGGADSTIRAVAPSSGAMSRRRAPTRHALAHAPSAATSSWCCLRLWLPAAALLALALAVATAPSLSAAGTDSSCSGRYMLLRQLLPRSAACGSGS